jgi:hypothetical protein
MAEECVLKPMGLMLNPQKGCSCAAFAEESDGQGRDGHADATAPSDTAGSS